MKNRAFNKNKSRFSAGWLVRCTLAAAIAYVSSGPSQAALRDLRKPGTSSATRSLTVTPSFTVSPSAISASADATNGVVSVVNGTTEQSDVSNSVPWLTVSVTATRSGSSGTLAYSISPNTSCSDRTGVFYVKTSQVTVMQAGRPSSYSLSASSASFSTNGGNGSVSLTANCVWSIQTDANWISITSPLNGSDNAAINFSVAPNSSNSSRTGAIRVYDGNSALRKTFTVSQSGIPLSHSLNYTNVVFGANGGNSNVVLTALAAWSAQSDVDWITNIAPVSGNGNATISYTVTANSGSSARTGSIRILDANSVVKQTLTIGQSSAAASYSFSATNVNFTSKGGSSNVQLFATAGWTVQSDASWVTGIAPSSGIGNATIGYSVAANSSCSSRLARIKILDANSVVQSTMTISQAGISGDFTVSYTYLLFPSNGGRISVGLTARCGWTAQTDVSWISNLVPSSGNSDTNISYTVSPNTGGERQGFIRILDSDSVVQQVVRIAQTGASPSYTISPASAGFAASGGKSNVVLNANTPWIAQSDSDWITNLTPSSGNGATNGTIQYTVLANTNSASRSGSIKFYDQATLTLQQTLAIVQSGAAAGRSETVLFPDRTESVTNSDGSTITIGSLDGRIYLGKADAGGNVLWFQWIKGVTGSPTAITADVDGNVFVAAQIAGETTVTAGALSEENPVNILVAKFSGDGEQLWLKTFGDSGSNSVETLSIEEQNLTMSGTFSTEINFGDLPDTTLVANGSSQNFIAELSSEAAGYISSKTF